MLLLQVKCFCFVLNGKVPFQGYNFRSNTTTISFMLVLDQTTKSYLHMKALTPKIQATINLYFLYCLDPKPCPLVLKYFILYMSSKIDTPKFIPLTPISSNILSHKIKSTMTKSHKNNLDNSSADPTPPSFAIYKHSKQTTSLQASK